MAGLADPNAAIELTLDRAKRLILGGHGSTLQILEKADAELTKRLYSIAKKNGGPTGKYTEAHAQLYREQIRLVMAYAKERLQGLSDEQAREAIAESVRSTVKLATMLEERFTGITRPLALHSQAMQDEVTRGTGASLIRQREASWTRYGAALTREFETALRVGQLAGLTHHEMISKLVKAGSVEGVDAASLNAKWPRHFPEPTGFVNQTYWAERIVRTETAYAYNAAGMNTIQTFKNTDFPDMQKKILAHFDIRTAPDSVAVHGQVRPLDGYFVDGAGRHYRHPPGRPNDRETVIPWRAHWAELDATEQPPEEDVAKALESISGKEAAREKLKSLAQERREQAQKRLEGIRIEQEQARLAKLQQVQLRKQRAQERAARRAQELQASRKPQQSKQEDALQLRELYETFVRFGRADVKTQREMFERIPLELDRASAIKLLDAVGSRVPVGVAMRHPRLVAALMQRFEVTEWEDLRVQKSVADLALMDPRLVHRVVNSGGWKFDGVYIGARRLPELDDLKSLRDMQPRGWGPGDTWNEVGGAGSALQVAVSVSGKSGSASTVLHEFGHAIGRRLFDDAGRFVESSERFREIHKRLYSELYSYFQQGGPGGKAGMQELFAEGVAAYHAYSKDKFMRIYNEEFFQWLTTVLEP